ncbi:four helix bundle protein [Christiangramia gaetbulicola]|uniref:Four helix bundle protein n=1 Tax=Christiangramia gaetbulicola TaxID=703340 RepID=A0A2T6AJX2_9FLAO|nr:four helix bundle protein [Christiangramia gaetbulicola]PTX44101.1 four helix bundle protein [Christiangramia gaetbulicola]
MEEVKFNFEDLKVYQKALDFVDMAYDLTSRFPEKEKYGLSSQLTRSAVSIALNTAEGSGDSDSQFHRYLQIAEGSVRECVTCTTIAVRRVYITPEENLNARTILLELLKMIRSLQHYLKNKKAK